MSLNRIIPHLKLCFHYTCSQVTNFRSCFSHFSENRAIPKIEVSWQEAGPHLNATWGATALLAPSHYQWNLYLTGVNRHPGIFQNICQLRCDFHNNSWQIEAIVSCCDLAAGKVETGLYNALAYIIWTPICLSLVLLDIIWYWIESFIRDEVKHQKRFLEELFCKSVLVTMVKLPSEGVSCSIHGDAFDA